MLLKKEVSKISWDDVSSCVVDCSDGSTYQADHVIVTVSLGVLKEKHKELFQPELPLYKQHTIKGLSIGKINKIFLRFPSRWWSNDCFGFCFIWDESDRLSLLEQFPHGPFKVR